jgi:hypothetical protein
MLRSGIALAGINLSLKEGKDEGIISVVSASPTYGTTH